MVIAIAAVLLGLLLPAMSYARGSARQTAEMSAARQLMLAYSAYAAANEDRLLTGYKGGLAAWDAGGVPIETVPAKRYPWRIAPYLDYAIRGLYVNENQELLERLGHEDPWLYRYGVSLFPSLGLNTTWLGGDETDLAFHRSFLRVFGKYYLTRMGQSRRPSGLVVFASAWGRDMEGPFGTVAGWYLVRSPRFTCVSDPRWSTGDEPRDRGFVAFRHGDEAVCAFLDGRVDTLPENELSDMHYWADQADDEDWCLAHQLPGQSG